MIEFVTGDFFDYKADIRINTVNCVGVMGAGVALEFKVQYPDMFKSYVEVCKNKQIAPGNPFLWEEYDLFSSCTIINLPTKIHWRNPSEYDYIEKDLIWLKEFLKDKDTDIVVTLPALGCGHGGLNWDIVKGKICHYLDGISAKVLVFEPVSSNKDLNNFHYTSNLQGDNIKAIYQTDWEYPRALKKILNNEIYCKGNTTLLQCKSISLLSSNDVNEKEISAISRTLDELPNKENVLIIGLNNKKHLELSKNLLEQGYSLVLVIPFGILNYKYENDLKDYWGRFVIVSYLKPNQEFKRYEYINSLKIRLSMANIILYCSEDYQNIKRNLKYLKGYQNLFYINFWKESLDEFSYLQARKIGLNPETKKPNVTVMQQYLDLVKIE